MKSRFYRIVAVKVFIHDNGFTIIWYSALSIYRGHFSLYNSRKIPLVGEVWGDVRVCKSDVLFVILKHNEVVGGYTGFTPSVRPSVRPSRMPCPLCNIYSSGWILSILGTNDHSHEMVCRSPWPLTLTYIFKVIRPWLRKSCPLCSIYSSWWILFIYGTNDHYH